MNELRLNGQGWQADDQYNEIEWPQPAPFQREYSHREKDKKQEVKQSERRRQQAMGRTGAKYRNLAVSAQAGVQHHYL